MTTRLTVRSIEAAKPGDMLTDSSLGRGSGKLVFWVRATKEWYYRYRLGGRSVLRKLGEYPAMGPGGGPPTGRELGRSGAGGHRSEGEGARGSRGSPQSGRTGGPTRKPGATARRLRRVATHPGEGERQGRRDAVQPRRGQALPGLVARKAADIGPEDIQAILARLVKKGVTRDVNKLRSYLRAAFQFGSGQDFDPATLARDGVVFKLASNPVTLIPRKPEYDRARDRVLTDAELRHVWRALEGRAPPSRNAVRLAVVLGGQRMTQLLRAHGKTSTKPRAHSCSETQRSRPCARPPAADFGMGW